MTSDEANEAPSADVGNLDLPDSQPGRGALRRWHPAAWLVAQFLAAGVPLTLLNNFANTLDAWGNASIAVAYVGLLTPFVLALGYGAWLSAIAPRLLERLAVPWYLVAWLASAVAALVFTAWALVSGPPVPSGPTATSALWMPLVLLPAYGSLVLGAYTISRLFRGATADVVRSQRPGRLVARAVIEAVRASVLLSVGVVYALVVVFLVLSALAAFAG